MRVNDVGLRAAVNGGEQLWVHEVGIGPAKRVPAADRRRSAEQADSPHPGEAAPQFDSLGSLQHCRTPSPPAARLRLLISHDRLERMHPDDLADIVEELGAEEREALFETAR